MSKVFISSVIGDFESFRQAAKQAVELTGHQTIMSEQFGARAYSSEIACTHEVEQSDIYILIMGERYGSKTPEDISVTHAEYQTALATNKPVLTFTHNIEMEPEQQAFRLEVENFQQGFNRAGFSTPEELKDEIIKALIQHDAMRQAAPQEDFKQRVETATKTMSNDYYDREPELALAFWPQPMQAIDIVSLESQLDRIFNQLCTTEMARMRDGYEVITGDDWTGLKTGKITYACFDDGLIILLANPLAKADGIFSGHFASPSILSQFAHGFWHLCNATSGYIHVELQNMDNTYVAEPPTGSSLSMRMTGKDDLGFSKLFLPMTQAVYDNWISQSLKRFERTFGYEPEGSW